LSFRVRQNLPARKAVRNEPPMQGGNHERTAAFHDTSGGPLGINGVIALRRGAKRLFRVSVLAANEADNCLRRWFASRGIG
jgi:hypothetical protein